MVDYYKNNKGYLLSLKPKNYFNIIIILYIILFYLLIFSFTYKVSDYIPVKIRAVCADSCEYYLYSEAFYTKKITKANKIQIEKNNYPYKIKKIGKLEYDEAYNINYQLIELKVDLPKKYQINNLYLDAKIKLKEEKLIKKLKQILFEGA